MEPTRRIAIVTGGTRGIGAAITERIARDGVHVAAVYATRDDRARSYEAGLARDGLSVSVHRSDVGLPEDCRRAVAEIQERFGRVDYLVNNAGALANGRVVETSIETWERMLRTNLSGVFYMTREVLPAMIAQGFGRIVSVSSVAAEMGGNRMSAYSAAKAGLLGFTRSLARETARQGITANIVMPGPTATDIDDGVVDRSVTEALERLIPMRRRARPEEVACAVRFLLDDCAGYVTGAVIPVDGGFSM